jgi:hypothetical protein
MFLNRANNLAKLTPLNSTSMSSYHIIVRYVALTNLPITEILLICTYLRSGPGTNIGMLIKRKWHREELRKKYQREGVAETKDTMVFRLKITLIKEIR